MGLRPHPPHRPLDPGDVAASTPVRPLRIRPGSLLGTSRGFTSQGPSGSHPSASLAFTRASPQPDPLEHLSSRHRRATGWKTDVARRSAGVTAGAEATLTPASSNDAAAPPFALAKKRWAVGPRTSRSHGPPAASLPPSHLSTGLDVRSRRTETARWNDPLARIGQHRSARLDDGAACATGRPGRGSLHPMLREEQ